MHIGVISDTHDRLDNIERALALFAQEKVDLVVHCGDWKSLSALRYFAEKADTYKLPVRGVLGNNDVDSAAFLNLARSAPGDFQIHDGVFELTLDETKVAIYHGHHAPTLRRVRESPEYSCVFLGHTHKPKIESSDGHLIVNPGSTAFAIPRSREWLPTVAIADTEKLTASLHSLDEMK